LLQLLPDQHQPAAIPDQDLHPVTAFGAEHDHCARKWIRIEHLGCQGSQSVGSFAEVYRTCGHQHPRTGGDGDHVRTADTRTARSTAVSWALSVPGTTRSTAPANVISMHVGATGVAGTNGTSLTIGTNPGAAATSLLASAPVRSRHAARRQPNTC
jgi:hypothetical protein